MTGFATKLVCLFLRQHDCIGHDGDLTDTQALNKAIIKCLAIPNQSLTSVLCGPATNHFCFEVVMEYYMTLQRLIAVSYMYLEVLKLYWSVTVTQRHSIAVPTFILIPIRSSYQLDHCRATPTTKPAARCRWPLGAVKRLAC